MSSFIFLHLRSWWLLLSQGLHVWALILFKGCPSQHISCGAVESCHWRRKRSCMWQSVIAFWWTAVMSGLVLQRVGLTSPVGPLRAFENEREDGTHIQYKKSFLTFWHPQESQGLLHCLLVTTPATVSACTENSFLNKGTNGSLPRLR